MVTKHIAFIMDGNGRWATNQGLPRSAGHKAGYEHIPDVLKMCQALGSLYLQQKWEAHLWTAGLPDVGLVIRTGSDVRLSNFMLW